MIETNDRAPAEDTAEVIRLTDAQQRRLALYAEQVRQAHRAFEEAFANILIGRGLDLDQVEARLADDGAAALIRPRTTAPTGG